ncbi:MSMEG_0569 family flavin-dependent oxidoreductase [Saccharospirillum mangrovi]|uniref:MSMEG_0569 family flavin-dependent oxidoreductase n=1 Tax=Saccharospirillum mangrovi TaxID=2161747 RepID=UPI000D36D290|nr:MSMEG_0569 family flavin-dependent oxidoreductase [Saccharospirillum mangrovi]
MSTATTHYPVIVIGGGQAGLSISYYLTQARIDHCVLEKKTVMHSWKYERWDSFTLVTPNWQCDLPGHPYDGNDPQGFMNREEIIAYLQRFADKVKAPVREGVTVEWVTSDANGRYQIRTDQGEFSADQVVVASGAYHLPVVPRMAERLPAELTQIHSADYKNADQLPEGGVLVVGSGQSGAQIAEDLHLAGRQVHLATGNAPRVARFYRGKDVVEWLDDMGYYRQSVNEHPLGRNVRSNTNHYVTGRDGGRDVDLRRFASEGMQLYGTLDDFAQGVFRFRANLAENLDKADATYNNINARIDAWIEQADIDTEIGPSRYEPLWQPDYERTEVTLSEMGITTILWCIGYRPDYSWLDAPVFNGQGYPQFERGISPQPGLYFLGLPWLHTWGSGRFSGIDEDARFLLQVISAYVQGEQLLASGAA